MAKINLLPWRAERRANRQKEFYGMLGLAAAGGLVLSFLIWFHYSQQISGQNTRNEFMKAEIQKVEGKIKEIEALDKQKDRLLARKKVIEQLQSNRSQMVHLFDSLVRTIPDGVALANIKQEGEVLTLEGRAQSNARVSNYMRNLESSGWMTNPDLSIIEAKAEAGAPGAVAPTARALPYAFTLKVKLANPNAPDAEGNVAVPPGAVPSAGAATVPAAPVPAPTQAPANTTPASGAAPPTPPAAVPGTAPPSNTPVEKPAPTNQGRPAS